MKHNQYKAHMKQTACSDNCPFYAKQSEALHYMNLHVAFPGVTNTYANMEKPASKNFFCLESQWLG